MFNYSLLYFQVRIKENEWIWFGGTRYSSKIGSWYVNAFPKLAYPVKVGVGVFRHVVVEHDVHALDVHSTAEQICCNQDALLQITSISLRNGQDNEDCRELSNKIICIIWIGIKRIG